MHAGHVHNVFLVHKAVAGVGEHGRGVHVPTSQLRHDSAGRHFAVAVGHVAAFGHAGRNLNGITQYVHVLGRCGLERQVIYAAPAVIGDVVKPGFDRNGACAHRRQYVQHGGFYVILHVKLHGVGSCIYGYGFVLRAVFHHAFVLLGPHFFEQRGFRRYIGVGVQNQHF